MKPVSVTVGQCEYGTGPMHVRSEQRKFLSSCTLHGWAHGRMTKDTRCPPCSIVLLGTTHIPSMLADCVSFLFVTSVYSCCTLLQRCHVCDRFPKNLPLKRPASTSSVRNAEEARLSFSSMVDIVDIPQHPLPPGKSLMVKHEEKLRGLSRWGPRSLEQS